MKLTSTDFQHEGNIPTRFTCEGEDISPQLGWNDLPENVASLALIVDDPDVPDPAKPQRTWVHWVLYNLPPQASGLSEASTHASLPPGAREGINDWGRTGYGGPCPPIGRHRYMHKLYALDTVLPDLNQPTQLQLEAAMQGHVLAEALLIGMYQKINP